MRLKSKQISKKFRQANVKNIVYVYAGIPLLSVLPINPFSFPRSRLCNCSVLLDQQEVREQFQFSALYIKKEQRQEPG